MKPKLEDFALALVLAVLFLLLTRPID